MTILDKSLEVEPNTPEETTGFNPSNLKLVQRGDVAYALSDKDNGDGDGTSEVQLIGSPSQLSELMTYNTGRSIQNGLKGQVSITLMKNSGETDEIGIVFPTDKGLSLSVCEAKYSINTSSFKCSGLARLQENINNDVSSIGSYSDLQATTLDNGDKFVIARKGRDLVSWYIEPGEKGKLEALAGTNGIIERKLLKLGNSGSKFVLYENTLFYLEESTKIEGNRAVEVTNIRSLNIIDAAKKAREGEGIEEYLLGDGKGQIDETPFFSCKNKINFLQLVERGEGDIIAFLEKDKSSNEERLSLVTILNDDEKGAKLLVYNNLDYGFKDSIKQLYVKDNGQGDAIVTAIGRENITTFIQSSNNIRSKEMIIPISSITSPGDFMHIIRGEFTPIASSTVAPITPDKEETSPVTDEPTTQGIGSTSGSTSNRVSTESATTDKPTTQGIGSTSGSTSNRVSTESATTDKPTTQGIESTMGSTDLITASSTAAEKSTVKSTTVKPTTADKITVTSQATERSSTVSTNAPITSARPTVFTRGIFTGSSPASTFTTPFLPQTSFSPQPTPLSLAGAGGYNNAGIAIAVLSVVGILVVIGFGAYSFVQRYRRRHAGLPEFNPSERNYKLLSDGVQDSDEELSSKNDVNGIPLNSISENNPSATPLSSVSVDPGNIQSNSPSHVNTPENSRNSSFSGVNDQPRSLLQRIMFCCGIGSRSSFEEIQFKVLVSGSESPESSRSLSLNGLSVESSSASETKIDSVSVESSSASETKLEGVSVGSSSSQSRT
ncbi:hypothetical protein [Wolbachia endosymbiont of Folsomia candida]|uniref:hypothetical protein n=1 Tax=Wolbachia endosymbiont of Folsomia candida TaxID=169402 RepID=UPI000AD8D125|nr:hypothetical protein [Wolbachia endosymbiont of Folsomia candida]APR97770.1 hypothetical protein ASM33_00205 [Wolbachia endosymbiont of Folsomia candida]